MTVYELVCDYIPSKSFGNIHGVYRHFKSAHNAMNRFARRLEREHAPFCKGTRVQNFGKDSDMAILWTRNENGVEERAVTLIIGKRKVR